MLSVRRYCVPGGEREPAQRGASGFELDFSPDPIRPLALNPPHSSEKAPARPGAALLPLLLLLLAVFLLAARDGVALGMRLPWGAAGSPPVLRADKLSGWLFMGTVHGYWAWTGFRAGLLWEWLPAVLFGSGLWLWLRDSAPANGRKWLRGVGLIPPGAAAAGVAAVAAAIAWFCFRGIPHVQDSIAQQFQAELFAAGHWTAPLPELPDFFPNEFLVARNGRWFAQYPPGQALFLALGIRAGAPWLVNPVLAAFSALLLWSAARRMYDRSTAALGLLFFALSPFVWFMSGERMNHSGTLFWICLALWALSPALSRRGAALDAGRAGLAGLALGMAVSTRPLCGVAVGLPLVMVAFWPARAGDTTGFPRLRMSSMAMLGGGLLLGAAPLLLFNWVTTGNPLRSGYELQWEASGWGFGTSQWGAPHTPLKGMEHLLRNWDGAAKYLWEWPVPGLIPLLGLWKSRLRRADVALLGTLAVLTLAYLPYFYQDLCLGPRFLYAGVPAFVLLSARGLRRLGVLLARRRNWSTRLGMATTLRAAAVCTVCGLALNLPVLFSQYGTSFWGTDRSLVQAVRDARIRKGIVFIRDRNRAREAELRDRGVSWRSAHGAVDTLEPEWIDRQMALSDRGEFKSGELETLLERTVAAAPRKLLRKTPPWNDYQGASSNYLLGFQANALDLERQPVIFALHRGEQDRELLRAYPGRPAWIWDWDQEAQRFRLLPRFDPKDHKLLASKTRKKAGVRSP